MTIGELSQLLGGVVPVVAGLLLGVVLVLMGAVWLSRWGRVAGLPDEERKRGGY